MENTANKPNTIPKPIETKRKRDESSSPSGVVLLSVESTANKPDTIPKPTETKRKRDESSQSVLLRVGECVHKTTMDILLSRDDNSFFHSQLSGRWGSDQMIVIDRDGSVFYDVLYYLRFGALPRGHKKKNMLKTEELTHLKDEAKFFLLPKLVKLCEDALEEALNPFRSFGDIGDFNASSYTDFKSKVNYNITRYDSEIDYKVEYKYEGDVLSCYCRVEQDRDQYVNIYFRNKCITDKESFCRIFRELRQAIENGRHTVTRAIAEAEIEPAARLFFAFVVFKMIDYYESYNTFKGGEWDDNDPIGFLFHDTTWGTYTGADGNEDSEDED